MLLLLLLRLIIDTTALSTLSMDAINLYGQRSQPEETPDFLSTSHQSLLVEIDKLPDETKAGWWMAQERCHPRLVGEEHRLMFLRCELFDVKVSGDERIIFQYHTGTKPITSSTHAARRPTDHQLLE